MRNNPFSLLKRTGTFVFFLIHILLAKPRSLKALRAWAFQLYHMGYLSLLIIVISGLFIGMVLAFQGFHTLDRFSATQQLGQLVALSVVRELGPVMTGLLFAGRSGSSVTAEIALMKATDQMAVIDMMGLNTIHWVVAPRFWAIWIALPCLCVIFSVVAILGGYAVGVLWLDIDFGAFWNNMNDAVSWQNDVGMGLVKSVVFGWVISWISVFQGYHAQPHSEGMSRATTATVVFSSLSVLFLDLVLTLWML